MSFQQNCERINDTFVVKCVEKIQEPLKVVVDQVPADSMSTGDWLTVGVGVLSAIGTGLAAWAAIKASSSAKHANDIALQESERSNQHNLASVRPYLHKIVTSHFDEPKKSCEVWLKNSGMGTAVVSEISYFVDGEIVANQDSESSNIQGLCLKSLNLNNHEDKNSIPCSISALVKGSAIISGVEIPLLISGFDSISEINDRVLNRIRIVIKYCDIAGNYVDEINISTSIDGSIEEYQPK